MTASPARSLAITGATLIDGSGAPPLPNATVVIEGERISRAGPAPATPLPEGAEVFDGRGHWIIPGLVESHGHVGAPDRQHVPLYIAAGVTTVLDLGGQLWNLEPCRADIEGGRVIGPRLYYTGPLLEEGKLFEGFAHMSRGFVPEQAEAVVDELVDAGVDAIKLYITVRPETARRACARAHARGLPVFMHQQATWGADAAEAGVDCLEHLMVMGELAPDEMKPDDAGGLTPFEYGGWMWRWLPDIDPEGERTTRLIERMVAAGTALDPTLVLFAARPGALGDDVGDTSLDDPERTPLLDLLPPPVADELINRWAERRAAARGASERARERTTRAWENILRFVGRFHELGGRLLAGTDCPNVAIVSGYSLHRELELLVRCGLSPLEALIAATRNPAERLDKAEVFGTVAPGRSADLLMLSGDPLADIRNTRRIERVIARGAVYKPETVLAGMRVARRNAG